MNKLYIDTSISELSLAIVVDSRAFIVQKSCKKMLVERLFPELEILLSQAGIELTDIEQVYVTKGPGSYTGARMGLTIAKVLKVLNPSLELFTCTTLEALLVGYNKGNCIALLDARNRAFFALEEGQLPIDAKRVELDAVLDLSRRGYKIIVSSADLESQKLLFDTDMICYDVLKGMMTNDDIFIKEEDANGVKPFYLKDPNHV